MEEKINNNINTTLQHFIYIHNQHPIEVKQMTQHLLRFSFILIHILPILQDNNLSYENKYQYLQKIQYQEQPLFTENTIKIICIIGNIAKKHKMSPSALVSAPIDLVIEYLNASGRRKK